MVFGIDTLDTRCYSFLVNETNLQSEIGITETPINCALSPPPPLVPILFHKILVGISASIFIISSLAAARLFPHAERPWKRPSSSSSPSPHCTLARLRITCRLPKLRTKSHPPKGYAYLFSPRIRTPSPRRRQFNALGSVYPVVAVSFLSNLLNYEIGHFSPVYLGYIGLCVPFRILQGWGRRTFNFSPTLIRF